MHKSLTQQFIHRLRESVPVSWRKFIGRPIAFVMYIINVYLRPWRKRPRVLSIPDTIDHILETGCSVIRFGDGEISMIDGLDIGFQNRSPELVARLTSIVRARDENLLICIPGVWEKLDMFKEYAYWFNMHHAYRHAHLWKTLVSHDWIYGDTNMTRPYLAYKDKEHAGEIFKKLFSIWENKDVILIEGAKTRLGIGNDMFARVRSIGRILCPPENAYASYEAIKTECLKLGKDRPILLSLGPAAKVLAYDLFKLGYRVVDIGHIDMEYEMFLRKEEKQVKVPYKYFNEIHARNPEECADPNYLRQIIADLST